MESWQERVIEEQEKLAEKILKLTTVVIQQEPMISQEEDKLLLDIQLEIMLKYNQVLQQRISLFGNLS